MNGLVDMVTGKGAKKSRQTAQEALAVQQRAAKETQKAQEAQEAAQLRALNDANERQDDLAKQTASQRRAIAARRSGRDSLSYTAGSGNLKSKLGE